MAIPWDIETRLEVAIAYLITGSPTEAGKLCNVPERTIRDWMKTEWWESVLSDAKAIKQKELDALWTGLIHKAADTLRERIDKGDAVLSKFGEVKYIPVKAKDLAQIMSIAVDKRALMRGQVTSRTEKITIDQKLEKIQDAMAKVDTTLPIGVSEEIKH